MRTVDPKRLEDLQLELVVDPRYAAEQLKPGQWRTKCNIGLCAVAEEFGITMFRGLLADEIIRFARKSKNFHDLSGIEAALHASKGGFAFGAMTSTELDETHGHVATVTGRDPAESGSLGHLVPYLCNIGLPPNGIKLSSACFPAKRGECAYYAFMGD